MWDIYSAMDEALSSEDDWTKVAVWAFYQGLDELREAAAAEGKLLLCPRDLGFASFDKWMRFNLHGDAGWSIERQEWEGRPAPRV